MKKQFICAVKKDIYEYMRGKKNFLFAGTLLMISIMMIFATKFLPSLINSAIQNLPSMITNTDTITSTLSNLFPSNLKDNMAIFSSDIVIFYGTVIIFATYNIISREIAIGKWIFPLCSGYRPYMLVLSKAFVYSVGSALPCFIVYNAYYFIGGLLIENNYLFATAIINAVVIAIAMFFITFITILLSSICSKPTLAATTMLLFVIIAPDIFALFSFGKFLPTHLLSYLYISNSNCVELIIPILMCLAISIVLIIVTVKTMPKKIRISRFEN